MEDFIRKLAVEIIEDFRSEDNKYSCRDRLAVSLHQIVDDFVSTISYKEVWEHLQDFNDNNDFATLDSGLYEGAIKEGLEHFLRVILYCLVEQELYNDEEFNKLQFIEEIAGIKLE